MLLNVIMCGSTKMFLLGLAVLLINSCFGSQDAARLFEDLLGNYNKLVRPVIKDEHTLPIFFKLKLFQILQVKWKDYRLVWDPEHYGNVSVLHLPTEFIWLPDIIEAFRIKTAAEGSPQVTTKNKARVYSDGIVEWQPPVIYNFMCNIKIEWFVDSFLCNETTLYKTQLRFPFDEQACHMKFGSWTYYGSQLEMNHLSPKESVEEIESNGAKSWTVKRGIDISEYQESVEWDVMSIVGTKHINQYPCCDYPFVDITYYITLRRKTLFFTMNLIIPCIVLSFLASLVFCLPSESHNKITLSVSVMVSLKVFVLLLIEIVPPTSLAIPLIGRYLLFTMAMVAVSVCVTIVVLNIHYQPEYIEMPGWLRKFFINFLAKLICLQKKGGKFQTFSKLQATLSTFQKEMMSKNESTKTSPFKFTKSYQDQELDSKLNTRWQRMFETDFESRFDKISKTLDNGKESEMNFELKSSDKGGSDVSYIELKKYHWFLWFVENSEMQRRRVRRTKLELQKIQASKNVQYIANMLKQQEKEANNKEEWKLLAMVIDRIFLIIFVGSVFLGICFIIFSAPHLKDVRLPVTAKEKV